MLMIGSMTFSQMVITGRCLSVRAGSASAAAGAVAGSVAGSVAEFLQEGTVAGSVAEFLQKGRTTSLSAESNDESRTVNVVTIGGDLEKFYDIRDLIDLWAKIEASPNKKEETEEAELPAFLRTVKFAHGGNVVEDSVDLGDLPAGSKGDLLLTMVNMPREMASDEEVREFVREKSFTDVCTSLETCMREGLTLQDWTALDTVKWRIALRCAVR